MKLYLASTENAKHCEVVMSHWTQIALTTYYSIKNKPDHLKDYAKKFGFKSYFLDSWAFGAWTRKESLDVVKYGEYIKRNLKYIDIYANLDDRDSERITEKNFNYLKWIWLKPLPVWSLYDWNFKRLRELLDEHDYIAIGSIVKTDGKKDTLQLKMKKMFQIAFSYWKNPDGSMKKKFHWFGITMVEFLIDFPWFSVDSTTRVWWARFWIIHIWDWKKIVLVQAKDHKKILQNWNNIPKELRDMDLIMDKPWKLNYINRQKISADCFKKIEAHCTKLWKLRGIFYT